MGTASFDISLVAQSTPSARGKLVTSGANATTTTASNLSDDSGEISARRATILSIHADVAMRVSFGGTPATATIGHYIPAGAMENIEITGDGPISVVDVA